MKNSPLPYCERLNTAAESINVMSNLGFPVVSLTLVYLLWRHAAQSSREYSAHSTHAVSRSLWIASLLPLLIGLGSTAYHYWPSRLTLLLDLGPIGLFAGMTLFLCLQHLMGLDRSRAGYYLMLWLVATAIAAPWPGYFYGSLIYLPTLIALLAVANATRHLLIMLASFVFTLALLMRTLDLPLCERLTTGTHPLWHLLAAIVTLLLLLALHRAMLMQR